MFVSHVGGTTTAIVAGGRKKVTTNYPDGAELTEEYDIITDELLVRKWKAKTKLGGSTDWEYEIGDPPERPQAKASFQPLGITAKTSNPIFCPRDTVSAWQWRIRNLLYPKEIYSLSVDEKTDEVILRTSNKKYYKRFRIPGLARLGMKPDEKSLSLDYVNSTVVIEYLKPREVIEAEAQQREERQKKLKAAKDGDVDCKQQ